MQRSQEAIVLAEELAHPFSLAFANFFAAHLHHFRRETQKIRTTADRALALCHEHGFAFYLAQSMCLQGCALAAQGQGQEAIGLMRRALVAHHATEAELGRAGVLSLMSEACATAGLLDEGLTAVAQALSQAHNTNERFYEAEMYRLRGELFIARDEANPQAERQPSNLVEGAEAEASFHQALAIARQQEAKSLELRAAIKLSQLWQRQGKRNDARELLTPVYAWFTEGFDTSDLQEARAHLDELDVDMPPLT